jgi:hypothetical protein
MGYEMRTFMIFGFSFIMESFEIIRVSTFFLFFEK